MNPQSIQSDVETDVRAIASRASHDDFCGTEPAGRIEKRPPGTQPLRVNYEYVAVLIIAHLTAGLALLPWYFSWPGVVSAIVGIFLFGMLGINVCFHRLLSHRSFECHGWFEYTLAILGTCCLQESPVWWTAVHRLHHRSADKPEDPHSPQAGLFWAHAGWLSLKNRDFTKREQMHSHVRDLMRQPFYIWIDRKTNTILVLLMQGVTYAALGFLIGWIPAHDRSAGIQMACSIVVWGVFVRTVVIQHLTWAVNSFGHRWGYRNFETPDDSRNSLLFGIISHGDGWHNNHHAHPVLARHGLKWWEIDTAYWAICLFERIGVVWNVRRDAAEPGSALPADVSTHTKSVA